MTEAPEVIYLQVEETIEGFDADDATWCADQINETDVKYIRADTIPPREGDSLADFG